MDEQPIIHSKTTVFYVCLRITDYGDSPGRKPLSRCWVVAAWKWMGALFFLTSVTWCHSLPFLKYKWALWLEILRVKGSYINGGDILWLLSGFWSWTWMMGNGFILLVTKPASLKPVYSYRMIHQHCPTESVMTSWRGRSVLFMTKVSQFWPEHKTVFCGALQQLQYLDTMTTKVWTCLFCFLGIKTLQEGDREKCNHRKGCWMSWGIRSHPTHIEHFLFLDSVPTAWVCSCVITQDGVPEEPCTCFGALLSPWSS